VSLFTSVSPCGSLLEYATCDQQASRNILVQVQRRAVDQGRVHRMLPAHRCIHSFSYFSVGRVQRDASGMVAQEMHRAGPSRPHALTYVPSVSGTLPNESGLWRGRGQIHSKAVRYVVDMT